MMRADIDENQIKYNVKFEHIQPTYQNRKSFHSCSIQYKEISWSVTHKHTYMILNRICGADVTRCSSEAEGSVHNAVVAGRKKNTCLDQGNLHRLLIRKTIYSALVCPTVIVT